MDSFVSLVINNRLGEIIRTKVWLSVLNKANSGENRESRTNHKAVVANGDEDNISTGIWVVPFYGVRLCKNSIIIGQGDISLKSKSQRGIIGFDYALSDSVILGAAYTRADSKLRHQIVVKSKD